jgi:RNA polymerase sigma-70 factor (ECF subfamily)
MRPSVTQDRLDTAPDVNESRLILDSQQANRQAFACLIERYWDSLYRWLCQLTRDTHLAEDLTQETFMKAYANIHRFQHGTNFRAWLFRIAHNNLVNVYRHYPKAKREQLNDRQANTQGPLEETLHRESSELLAQAVSRLPTDFRSAFLLRVDQGLSFKQIGEILHITEQTARWRVFKARQKLLATLDPNLLSGEAEELDRS